MKKPNINTNGTSRETLLKSYGDSYQSLSYALCSLHDTYPNSSDYFTREAYIQAIKEHMRRVADLKKIIKDVQVLQLHCAGCKV